MDGKLYSAIECEHVRPGKGGVFTRVRLKSLDTGAVLERTFKAAEKVKRAILDEKEVQYLYNADGLYYFMDNKTYEQTAVSAEILGDGLSYLKENENITIRLYKDQVFEVTLPTFVELKVIKTEPGMKGDTAGGGVTKAAILETKRETQVPLFVNEGDVLKIDTRTGEYVERV